MARFYTPRQLAEKSGVKLDTLYHHIHRGKLTALKIDDSWYIVEDEARKYAKRHGVGFWRSMWPF